MNDNVYSPLKILAYPGRLRAARDGGRVAPVHVNVDLTNFCSQACRFCMWQTVFSLGGQTREMDLSARIPERRLVALVPEFVRAGVKGVEITGGGEPTAHAAFDDFVERLVDADIKVGVITNGDFLERHFEALRKVTFLRLSISSLIEARYQAIRRPKLARSIAETLMHLERLCALPGPPDREIGIGLTIAPENVDEVFNVCAMAKAAGCTNVRLTTTWVDDPEAQYTEAFEGEVVTQVALARAGLEGEHFHIYGPDEWRAYQLENKPGHAKRYARCSYAFFVVNITADGKCWPCCVQRHVPGWDFGSIHETPFDEIVLGARRDELVRTIDVKTCMPCIWSPRNEAMEPYLDGRSPIPDAVPRTKHQEFI